MHAQQGVGLEYGRGVEGLVQGVTVVAVNGFGADFSLYDENEAAGSLVLTDQVFSGLYLVKCNLTFSIIAVRSSMHNP